MDGKAAKSIEGILEAYDKQQQTARREMERRTALREEFLNKFDEKSRTMIRPVMEQAGNLMERSGHQYEITEQIESPQHNGKSPQHNSAPTNALIKLTIFPNGERPRTQEQIGWPHVAMIVNPSRNTVLAHESAMMPNVGGPFGTAGEYTLEELTADVVEAHIINVLALAMGVGRASRVRMPKRSKRSKRPVMAPVSSEPLLGLTGSGERRLESAYNYLSGPLDPQP